MEFDDFDQQMRRFEGLLDERFPDSGYAVIRIDGRGFSKLTKEKLNYERPFDERFHAAMKVTCEHLMQAGVQMALCFTQSDEASFLLRQDGSAFGRKTRKLNSVMAGEASGVFSLTIGHPVAFDCRISPLPSAQDVVDYFRWRAEDAKRNALSAHGYWTLRAKGVSGVDAEACLSGMSQTAKLSLLSDHGVEFDKLEEWKRLGALLIWQTVPHAGVNLQSGKEVKTTRRRLKWVNPVPVAGALSTVVRREIGATGSSRVATSE